VIINGNIKIRQVHWFDKENGNADI
jgi:hypothetical protein